MTKITEGGCQCGGVRFRITGGFDRFYLCHCSRCRKDSGSAHGANLFSGTARLEILCGADLIKTYQIPQTRHAKAFCAHCGAALPLQAGPMLVVPAGALEGDPGIRPTAHICDESRAPWDQRLEDVPRLPGMPG